MPYDSVPDVLVIENVCGGGTLPGLDEKDTALVETPSEPPPPVEAATT
jgi:hypothetical protein